MFLFTFSARNVTNVQVLFTKYEVEKAQGNTCTYCKGFHHIYIIIRNEHCGYKITTLTKIYVVKMRRTIKLSIMSMGVREIRKWSSLNCFERKIPLAPF